MATWPGTAIRGRQNQGNVLAKWGRASGHKKTVMSERHGERHAEVAMSNGPG